MHGFGNLYHIRNIIVYTLSPFQQKAYAGVVSHGIPNTIRRCKESFLYIVPPLAFGFLLIGYIDNLNKSYARKNPKDYENDE